MADGLPKSAGHPFYQRLNALLAEADFDRWIGRRCRSYYEQEEKRGQPSIPPAVYFRMLLVDYSNALSLQGQRQLAEEVEHFLSSGVVSQLLRMQRTVLRTTLAAIKPLIFVLLAIEQNTEIVVAEDALSDFGFDERMNEADYRWTVWTSIRQTTKKHKATLLGVRFTFVVIRSFQSSSVCWSTVYVHRSLLLIVRRI